MGVDDGRVASAEVAELTQTVVVVMHARPIMFSSFCFLVFHACRSDAGQLVCESRLAPRSGCRSRARGIPHLAMLLHIVSLAIIRAALNCWQGLGLELSSLERCSDRIDGGDSSLALLRWLPSWLLCEPTRFELSKKTVRPWLQDRFVNRKSSGRYRRSVFA